MRTATATLIAFMGLTILASCGNQSGADKDSVSEGPGADVVAGDVAEDRGASETTDTVPRLDAEAEAQDVCQPDCAGKECGDNGCGGSCGECDEEELLMCVPETGKCAKFDPPQCEGKECGDDGMGGSCGKCEDGFVCEDGNCVSQGCQPNCTGKQCGADGCGGTCGVCEEGLECLNTKFGLQCTTVCELFTCSAGQLCLFGLCVNQECETDDDCGGGPAHYCDEFLQCKDRKACQTTADCKTSNKTPYCDTDVGFCMDGGNCWDDLDCPGGTCGADHWCFGHNCLLPDSPGCPPHLPICDMPFGEEPLCDGLPCASCVGPCIFDADCPAGKQCSAGTCFVPGNDCVLDADCAEGQYCHPGCVDLKPVCDSEADCEGGKLCLAGFCVGDEVVPCGSDSVCLAWAEGYTCQDGACKPEGACVLDGQCGEGQYCHGTCLPIPSLPECKTDAGCLAGQICENEQCQEPPECYYGTLCPAGHICEDMHCYNNEGVCAWLEKGSGFCDDGDPCTEDTCDAVIGCVHTLSACE